MSELVLGEALAKCRYCRLPSQEDAHAECERLVQQWGNDNFDMKGFWTDYLDIEADKFRATNNDVFNGFMPYTLHSIRNTLYVSNTMEIGDRSGFEIVDQNDYGEMWLHTKYCNIESYDYHIHHDYNFACFLSWVKIFREVEESLLRER